MILNIFRWWNNDRWKHKKTREKLNISQRELGRRVGKTSVCNTVRYGLNK
jgi:hypothetical protein